MIDFCSYCGARGATMFAPGHGVGKCPPNPKRVRAMFSNATEEESVAAAIADAFEVPTPFADFRRAFEWVRAQLPHDTKELQERVADALIARQGMKQ